MLSLVAATLLLAADGGTPSLEPLPAPLGELVDVLTDVPASGVPGSERVVVAKLPGCDKPQAVWITRFVLGSAVAARQVRDWLGRAPAVKRALYGKADPLTQAIQRARRSAPRPGACSPSGDWPLGAHALQPRSCKEAVTAIPADHLFEDKGKVGQVARLSGADASSKDRCRPRLSALLADDKGVPRFALHADYGGVMSAELYGDRCQLVRFDFDVATQAFLPTRLERPDCKKR